MSVLKQRFLLVSDMHYTTDSTAPGKVAYLGQHVRSAGN